MNVNFVFSNSLVYSDFERDYFFESNDMPHVRMHLTLYDLTVTAKINKLNSIRYYGGQ
jgi:hypothetical protein